MPDDAPRPDCYPDRHPCAGAVSSTCAAYSPPRAGRVPATQTRRRTSSTPISTLIALPMVRPAASPNASSEPHPDPHPTFGRRPNQDASSTSRATLMRRQTSPSRSRWSGMPSASSSTRWRRDSLRTTTPASTRARAALVCHARAGSRATSMVARSGPGRRCISESDAQRRRCCVYEPRSDARCTAFCIDTVRTKMRTAYCTSDSDRGPCSRSAAL